MLDDMVQVVILLVVGIVALIVALMLIQNYLVNKNLAHLLWAISFLVLFVAGLLIILEGFTILNEPLIQIVAVLIPACLAIGLLHVIWSEQKYWLYYSAYIIIFLVVLIIVEYDIIPDLSQYRSIAIMGLHVPSGLIITFLPVYTTYAKTTDITGLFFAAGGLAISIGGVLLAFLKIESLTPILTDTEIFAVLPTLLLIVGVLFVISLALTEKWKIQIPMAK
ncbi:MAG: hypothetical protein ACW981_06085 [Candidatus Hodarchaeales archaeon]|jgi:hypothetical protein